jgi:outer membrane protein assembly factor BamD
MMRQRRLLAVFLLVLVALLAAGCGRNKRVQNPIADLGSVQPDKVLYDRAMEAIARNRYDTARLTLQTLINTYPDSEYVARAKLGVGDAWYAEGTAAALAQAEIEYKDFITFFPHMPEAAEAQLKIANIHYEQMHKPDRDFTHAKRAEDEFRELLREYPDHPLREEARLRLLEVQEVLAEREYRIGRFYHLRESDPAAIARLKSVSEAYPLYSRADEALYLLGGSYERQLEATRSPSVSEGARLKLGREFAEGAAQAYSRILTRYPLSPRADEARRRLEALEREVPEPTEEAIARHRVELESRSETSRMGRFLQMFRRGPDVATATRVGEPTMEDPRPVSAPEIVRRTTDVLLEGSVVGAGGSAVTVQPRQGTPPPSDAIPRSAPAAEDAPAPMPPQVNDAEAPPAKAKDKDDGKEGSSSSKKKKGFFRRIIP